MTNEIFNLSDMFSDSDFHADTAENINFWGALPPVPDIEVDGALSDKGSNPVLQTFFEGPEKCECCINWVEKQPMEIPQSEKTRYEKAAICLYRRKDHTKKDARLGGLISMTDDRLVLQSQRLIELIRPDLARAGFLIPTKGEIEFLAPFKELYFSYSNIYQHKEQLTTHSEDWRYMNLLVDVMCSLLSDTTSAVSKLLSKSSIDYDNLWTIFPKNAVGFYKMRDQDMLAQVIDASIRYYGHKSHTVGIHKKEHVEKEELGLIVRYRSIAFDGVNFGIIEKEKLFRIFEGDKLITSLDFYPVGFHPNHGIMEQLCQRGTRILDLQDMVHCEYEGTAVGALDEDTTGYVTGRVVVDVFRFSIKFPDELEWTDPIEDNMVTDLLAQGNGDITQDLAIKRQDTRKHEKLPRINRTLDRRPTATEQKANKDYFTSRRHLLVLMHPFVQGFSFKYNKWFDLHVLKLRDITWTQQPLDRLIFDDSIKSMLSSFVRHHTTSLRPDSGIMAAKGAGLAVLLSGPPGTGKTLTAEVVAEEAHLPLYRVLAGELGSTPSAIETSLREILDLASGWQCVVLLDEVDTFISTRKSSDRTASEIVSIFLRQMEYYRGIIFLTTNLPRNIDSAFRSRCRLHIQYEPLGLASRLELWRSNFDRAGLYDKSRLASNGRPITIVLNDAQMDSISEWKLSGRDIHNIVQNVVLWSIADGSDVSFERLNTSIKLTVPYANKTSFDPIGDEPSGILVQSETSSSNSGARKRARPNDDDMEDVSPSAL